jgi:hypothetical protein
LRSPKKLSRIFWRRPRPKLGCGAKERKKERKKERRNETRSLEDSTYYLH